MIKKYTVLLLSLSMFSIAYSQANKVSKVNYKSSKHLMKPGKVYPVDKNGNIEITEKGKSHDSAKQKADDTLKLQAIKNKED